MSPIFARAGSNSFEWMASSGRCRCEYLDIWGQDGAELTRDQALAVAASCSSSSSSC